MNKKRRASSISNASGAEFHTCIQHTCSIQWWTHRLWLDIGGCGADINTNTINAARHQIAFGCCGTYELSKTFEILVRCCCCYNRSQCMAKKSANENWNFPFNECSHSAQMQTSASAYLYTQTHTEPECVLCMRNCAFVQRHLTTTSTIQKNWNAYNGLLQARQLCMKWNTNVRYLMCAPCSVQMCVGAALTCAKIVQFSFGQLNDPT